MSVPELYNDFDLPDCGLELLNDRFADPHMTDNLIEGREDVALEIQAIYNGWVTRTAGTPNPNGKDPLMRTAIEDGPFLYIESDDLIELTRIEIFCRNRSRRSTARGTSLSGSADVSLYGRR